MEELEELINASNTIESVIYDNIEKRWIVVYRAETGFESDIMPTEVLLDYLKNA